MARRPPPLPTPVSPVLRPALRPSLPDRVEETLAAIANEPWLTMAPGSDRQMAEARRRFIATTLRSRIAGRDRKALDDALNLGQSFQYSAERERQRRGVRAVLLGELVFKGAPLSQAKALRLRHLNASAAGLRAAFLATVPSVFHPNDPRRLAWMPAHFTDPASFPMWAMREEAAALEYRFIVSCLPDDDRARRALAAPDFAVQGWSAIRCSVVDQGNSVMSGHYGFVLRVPHMNVLAAHSRETNLVNPAGAPTSRGKAYEQNLSDLEKRGLLTQHIIDMYARFGGLASPHECIHTNRNDRWNEVIVAGRGLGGPTRVAALFFRMSTNHRYYVPRRGFSPITADIARAVQQCATAFDLPILYLPDGSGRFR